jgi:TPR repeat protein
MAEDKISDAVTAPRYVTCPCQYCSGKIEFDANQLDSAENTTVPCPHCGLETIIFVPKQQGVPPIISPVEPPKEFTLGVAWFNRGNYNEAVECFAEAARQEHPDAQNYLGLCFANGWGVAKDEVEAVKWYRKAAEQNCALAQSRLGLCYANGQGVVKDAVEAVKWYRKAADLNFADAQFLLGTCYVQGHGIIEDHSEGVKWWRKAAEQGSAGAAFCLGLAYQHGRGVTKDQSEAIKWYRKAAEQNHAPAQGHLSDYYERAQDYVEAYKWAKLAAGQGYEGAQKKRENLVLKMNAAQIEALESSDRIIWRNEWLTPKQFSEFIGQERVKARLELAAGAAKQRQEAIDHILLIGPPGSGKATLGHILAKAMGANLKSTSGPTIEKAGDLADLLTSLDAGDVLFIDEIHRLRRYIVEYLYPAMKDFKLDIIIDQGPNARSVRLNLPRFTLIGTTPRKEPLTTTLLSCFPIIEKMDAEMDPKIRTSS